MDTRKAVEILSRIATRDEAGAHFTALYASEHLAALEAEGYLNIERHVHARTGIAYSEEFYRCTVSEDGAALVEANPEYAFT